MGGLTLLGMVWLVIFVEGAIFIDLESPKSKLRKKLNSIEYKMEKHKYEVYPLKKNALAWRRIEDIPKFEKGTTINLDKERQKLIATLCIQKNGKRYWKMYIFNEDNIEIVYVQYEVLCLLRVL